MEAISRQFVTVQEGGIIQICSPYRPNVVLALLTTQTASFISPTNYTLQDWAAGLRQPSVSHREGLA